MKYKDHPYAAIFPLADEEGLKILAGDIHQNGLHFPITLHEGMILDGRNRYRACLQAKIEPAFIEFGNGDPVSYVISANAVRRDLTKSQRAAAAVNAEELVQRLQTEAKERQKASGGDVRNKTVVQKFAQPSEKTRDQLAKLFAVNRQYIQDAWAIKSLPAELDELTKAKDKEWQQLAARFVELRSLFPQLLSGDLDMGAAKREREKFEYEKRVLAAAIAKRKLPELVLADPPWDYNDGTTSPDRVIENQYATLNLETICSHKPDTAPDCILLLWATAPLLREALRVMEEWSFAYVTHAIWDKQKPGLGYWFRGRHELLLVGTKGKPARPIESKRVDSIFEEPRGKHSEKPQAVYDWIEAAFAPLEKLEMYARKARDGWKVWGDEV
jgi:N6-adenosine-specific RNA methylase IME4